MSVETKDFGRNFYDAALITAGATAAGFIAKKAFGDSLDTPTSLKGAVKFWAAVGLGTIGVKILLGKKWLSADLQVQKVSPKTKPDSLD